MKSGNERIYQTRNFKLFHQNVPKKQLAHHRHEEAHLFIPLEGTIQINIAEKDFKIPAGQMLFVSAEIDHSFLANNKSGERLILQFKEDPKKFKALKAKSVLLPLNQLIKTLCLSLFPSASTPYASTIEKLILEVLEVSLHEQVQGGENAMFLIQEKILGCSQPALKSIFQFMEEDAALTLETICKKGGTSLRSLTRLVKNEIGLSPKELYTFFRVQRACRLIHEGQLGLTAIAFECGYASLSQFINNFKKWTGQRPSDFKSRIS